MDFSAFNPNSSNSLSMAARNNNTVRLEHLLRHKNPNCVDNRGWTCLHEAAAHNHYEAMKIILNHPDCRPLSETFEGHTALYLAVRNNCSIKCIELLLDSVDYIAQYASNEMVSPLHLACMNENLQIVELLLQHNSIIDLQDFDGDTPLHEAVSKNNQEIISLLLYSGADLERRNYMGLTPFHIACAQGIIDNVKLLLPFVTDIDDRKNVPENSPLMFASQLGHTDIVEYLLSNGADPNLTNNEGDTALTFSVTHGHEDIFKILLKVTDCKAISPDIFMKSCQPLYFNINIAMALLESDLDYEFFNRSEELPIDYFMTDEVQTGRVVSVLHHFLLVADYIYKYSREMFVKMFYLLLMRGVSVNALTKDECPPLVDFHHCRFINSFDEVFKIMLSHGCNVDHVSEPTRSDVVIPDVIKTAIMMQSHTLIPLLEYSVMCEPENLIFFAREVSTYIYVSLKQKLTEFANERMFLTHLKRIFEFCEKEPWERLSRPSVHSLQHISRKSVRQMLRDIGVNSTKLYMNILPRYLPHELVLFVRYMI